MNDNQSEADAVLRRYARRCVGDLYSFLRPEVWMSFQERERVMLKLLRQHAPKPLNELRVLEVGCGTGSNLLELARIGFDPEKMVGNELLPERAAKARHNLPGLTAVYQGDALTMSFGDESFDIVYLSLVFSSLLDDDYQFQLAQRIWRWLHPGGAVLWYDFIYNNPANPDVRGVSVKRVAKLFPNARIDGRRITLAPPISRRVAALHPALYTVLNTLVPLRTHVLCWIGKT